jgi:hypothetical protein
LLAPGIMLGSVMSGVLGGSLGWELERPITISQLRTELSADGRATPKAGVALIVEPITSDYHIQFQSAPVRLWSSLDEQTAHANQGRLTLDRNGVTGKAPFFGVSDPVTVVIEGEIGEDIFLPGSRVKTDNWQLPSRRSESIVSSALLSCVFAFGMSLARGVPPANRPKQTAS